MTGNQQDAEEVVQEAFLRAYQKLSQFASRANFGTWVYRIAANYAIDRMRQRKSEDSNRQQPARETEEGAEVDLMSTIPDGAPSPERLAQSGQLAVQMRLALSQLTPAERTAFVMRHWGGSGIEEIADALKSSSSAARIGGTFFSANRRPFRGSHRAGGLPLERLPRSYSPRLWPAALADPMDQALL